MLKFKIVSVKIWFSVGFEKVKIPELSLFNSGKQSTRCLQFHSSGECHLKKGACTSFVIIADCLRWYKKNIVILICKAKCTIWANILLIFQKLNFRQTFGKNVEIFECFGFHYVKIVILGIFDYSFHAFSCATCTIQI